MICPNHLLIFIFLIIFQYSLDNEAERQKYEILQAQQHIQPEENTPNFPHQESSRIGGPPNLQTPHQISSPINEQNPLSRNNRIMAAANDRRVQAPRSANLEQLYHEALPMNKALSHSGPSAFGNGLIVSFIELPILKHKGLIFEKKCCSILVI